MSIWDLFRQPPPVYPFVDWGEPVPQRRLKELGLPAKYALDPSKYELAETGKVQVTTDSYPWQSAVAGDLTVEAVWRACPAYRDTFSSPSAMLWGLLHLEGVDNGTV